MEKWFHKQTWIFILLAISIMFVFSIIIYHSYYNSEGFTTSKKEKGNEKEKGKGKGKRNDEKGNEEGVDGLRGFYINMDKNESRNLSIKKNIETSDLKSLNISRYSAVVGKNVKLTDWLTPVAMNEIKDVEKNGYRTRHYQLTRGGVGCFLSHYNLAKQLIDDTSAEYYLIMEDDMSIHPNALSLIKQHLENAPNKWDMLSFSYIRLVEYETVGKLWIKPSAFWGTGGYIINKKGAKKIVKEVDNIKIDGQIDSYLARMVQKGDFNIYIAKQILFRPIHNTTDIQMPIRILPGIDPFDFWGYKV